MEDEFRRFDTNRNGQLEPREVALLFRSVMPGLSPQQLRYLTAHIHTVRPAAFAVPRMSGRQCFATHLGFWWSSCAVRAREARVAACISGNVTLHVCKHFYVGVGSLNVLIRQVNRCAEWLKLATLAC